MFNSTLPCTDGILGSDTTRKLSVTVLSGPASADAECIARARAILEKKKIILNQRIEPFTGLVDIAKAGVDAAANVSSTPKSDGTSR